MKKFLLCCLLVGFLYCDSSLAALLQGVRSTELKNGLKIYVIEDKRLPVVLHMLAYKVGGMHDPQGFSGLAHFFEHLMFSGTEKCKDFSTAVNGLGGRFNAVTNSAYTIYYELIGKEHLSLMMELEADRMHNLSLTPKHIERERNVVLEERKMRTESTARGLFAEEIVNIFYRNSYGRPVVGWEHEIASYDRKTVESFYRQHYNPNNAVLLVAGDVNFDEVVKLARVHYADIENHCEEEQKTRVGVLEPEHRADVMLKMESVTVSDPEIFMLYKAPSLANSTLAEYCAASLAADIVAGDEFGILYDELVRKKSLLTHIEVSYDARERSSGVVLIGASLRQGVSLESVDKEVRRVLRQLVDFGVPRDIVEIARDRASANLLYAMDGIESKAWFHAVNLAVMGRIVPVDSIMDAIKRVEVEDVNSALRDIFSGTKVEGYLLPKRKESIA